MGDDPDVDVSIRVLYVLRKQPNGWPLVSICWHKNNRSSRGVTVEMSSMNANKFVIPPLLSSNGFPAASRAAALSLRLSSIGLSRRATTSDPKIGDSGHPCVDPSSI